MSSKRKRSSSKFAIHPVMHWVDACTAWMARYLAEPGTQVPALARARVIPRRARRPLEGVDDER